MDVARGNVSKFPEMLRRRAESSPQFRCGKDLEKNLLLQVVNSLTSKDCLRICYRTNPSGFRHAYPQLGQNTDRLWSRQLPILLTVAKRARTQKKPAERVCETPEGATENGLVENELVREITPRLSEAAQREFRIALTACRNTLVSIYGSGVNILTNSVIEELAATVPTTEDELLTIDKITPIFVKKFGEPLLRFIRTHLHDNHIVLATPFCSRGLLRRRQQEVVRQGVRQQGVQLHATQQYITQSQPQLHTTQQYATQSQPQLHTTQQYATQSQPQQHITQQYATQQPQHAPQRSEEGLIEDFDALDDTILDAFEGMERECMETREVSHPSRYFPSQGNTELYQGVKRDGSPQMTQWNDVSVARTPQKGSGVSTPNKSQQVGSSPVLFTTQPNNLAASPSKRAKSGLRSMLEKKVVRNSQMMEVTDLTS